MPFGAEVRPGETRFRLWAPAARGVELCLWDGGGARSPDWTARPAADREQARPMTALADGWFECLATGVGHGDLYRYRIDAGLAVPDPASRFQPLGVHGPSQVVDPAAFDWGEGPGGEDGWHGRPWEEAIFYELHLGTFTPEGTCRAAAGRLDYLADLGVTALELMPVAAFPGTRNWGYDGVLPFAPAACYGRPEELKALVRAAHQRRLMVFLDVVYNHFGPEGNYLHLYAPPFFTDRHHTPWGAAINFDGADGRPVRDFFIHNALFWLEEYRFDGLRLDAVHAIRDDSEPDILIELAERVREGPGRERQIHLVLENDANASRYLAREPEGRPRWYAAQWNDDAHHILHHLISDEADGYYADYVEAPVPLLGRCLTQGFAWQGEPSPYRGGATRGEPSAHLPPAAFVNLLQNHDQVGNRAFGERIDRLAPPQALRAALALLLLAPSPPLLFMGQEFMAPSPFLFFCDFGDDLAQAVTAGRRREFARFARFADPAAREAIPDPADPDSFARSRLPWEVLDREPHAAWLRFHRELLALRHREILPRLAGMAGGQANYEPLGHRALRAWWRLGDGAHLTLTANLGAKPVVIPPSARGGQACSERPLPESAAGIQALAVLPSAGPSGGPTASRTPRGAEPPGVDHPALPLWLEAITAVDLAAGLLPPWSVAWQLEGPNGQPGTPKPSSAMGRARDN